MVPALFPRASEVCSTTCDVPHARNAGTFTCSLGASTGFGEHPRLPQASRDASEHPTVNWEWDRVPLTFPHTQEPCINAMA